MVEHRLTRRLACHHCGHIEPVPRACPECGNEDSLVACGPGVERIADEVAGLWSDARAAIVTPYKIWSHAQAAEFVHRMEEGAIDIVVVTHTVPQAYHFPNLPHVRVIDDHVGLERADERLVEID